VTNSLSENPLRRFATAALVAVLPAVVAVSNASGEPIALSTPAGLNPGDSFRFLYVTQGQTTAESVDIGTYNTFVQSQASGATYNGITVNWKAIGSTFTVAARDNVGGFNTLVPVYLPNGTQLAFNLTSGTGGLWSASLLAAPNGGIDGSTVSSDVWTGSTSSGGSGGSFGALGATEFPLLGLSSSTSGWLSFSDSTLIDNLRPMYGLSETLIAVPEPSTYAMALAGLACGGFSMWRRRKRA